MKLRLNGLARIVFVLGLAAGASPLAAQPTEKATSATATDKRLSAYALKVPPPIKCSAGQLVFQGHDGKYACIAPDANPCPQGQVLDKTTKPGFAACKPLPAKPPFSCPSPQLVFQRPDGKIICIAPDANPCPQGQVLDTTTKPGFAACKPLPDPRRTITCPAGQVAVQQANGRFVCVAKP